MSRILRQFSALAGRAIGVLLAATTLQTLSAQEFIWAPDFPVGSTLPEVSAEDQDGQVHNFNDLKGENGLLFVYSRSFDW
jgi:hypothetical protein